MVHEARKEVAVNRDQRAVRKSMKRQACCAAFARTGSFQPGRMKWQV